MRLDFTHDPARASWVASANRPGGDFPLQNLPHGVFRRRGSAEAWRGGVAIGDEVLDMAAACEAGVFTAELGGITQAAAADTLNGLMALGRPAWRALRGELSRGLEAGSAWQQQLAACLVSQADVEHRVPAHVGNYTDFFTSQHHMLNMGRLFHPDKPVLPQFKWLPIAYHGRASTVEVSGAAVLRPRGQAREPGADAPRFGPTRFLDYELELGAWVGPGNARGQTIPIDEAQDRLFGLSLLNDWSARDLQGWESQPLGPFLAKNFITTVSPWIVTMEALLPFRCAVHRDAADPPLLPHLAPRADAGLDLAIEALIATGDGGVPQRLSLSSTRHASWGFAQMLAHHASNGCAMNPGDLLGSGTQSGPGDGEQGCLMELTMAGRRPLSLAGGGQRSALEDGDTVILRAWGQRPGAARIGFGDCRGTVQAA